MYIYTHRETANKGFFVFFSLAGHYGKDIYRSGGPDLHNFISSGFVTLGRGHTKGTVETIFC